MTETEAEAWDVLSDTDALRCCSCPSCNHYLPHDEADAARLGVPKYDPDSTCEVRGAIERIVAARVAADVSDLAEPLCRRICDLLGEPRILVPGEVSALLAAALTEATQ